MSVRELVPTRRRQPLGALNASTRTRDRLRPEAPGSSCSLRCLLRCQATSSTTVLLLTRNTRLLRTPTLFAPATATRSTQWTQTSLVRSVLSSMAASSRQRGHSVRLPLAEDPHGHVRLTGLAEHVQSVWRSMSSGSLQVRYLAPGHTVVPGMSGQFSFTVSSCYTCN